MKVLNNNMELPGTAIQQTHKKIVELTQEKSDLNLATKFYERSQHGDHSSSVQAKNVLAHY